MIVIIVLASIGAAMKWDAENGHGRDGSEDILQGSEHGSLPFHLYSVRSARGRHYIASYIAATSSQRDRHHTPADSQPQRAAAHEESGVLDSFRYRRRRRRR